MIFWTQFCCSTGAIWRFKREVRCTRTYTKGKPRKARVRNIFLKSLKKIFNEHPVDKSRWNYSINVGSMLKADKAHTLKTSPWPPDSVFSNGPSDVQKRLVIDLCSTYCYALCNYQHFIKETRWEKNYCSSEIVYILSHDVQLTYIWGIEKGRERGRKLVSEEVGYINALHLSS